MRLEQVLALIDLGAGLAFCQQSLEHLANRSTASLSKATHINWRDERLIHLPRLVCALLLICQWQAAWAWLGLLLLGMAHLYRFQGPYNGGSDRMSLLIIICMCGAYWLPSAYWRDVALGYLGAQVTLSYFMAGWVKVVNPEWRSGQALRDVFRFSAYPVSESLRGWAHWPRLLWCMSWSVMLLELALPLALLHRPTLYGALLLTGIFHLCNALLFGLNRFFWIWISSYPALLWLQQRL